MSEKPSAPVEEYARNYVGAAGMPGDLINGIVRVSFCLNDPKEWPDVERAVTYREYLLEKCGRDKFDNTPALVDAIVRMSNAEWVQKHDAIIARINAEIGNGVTTQKQADTLKELCNEITAAVYGQAG